MPDVGGSFDVRGEIGLNATSSHVLFAAGSKSDSDTLSRSLDVASGLSLRLADIIVSWLVPLRSPKSTPAQHRESTPEFGSDRQ